MEFDQHFGPTNFYFSITIKIDMFTIQQKHTQLHIKKLKNSGNKKLS